MLSHFALNAASLLQLNEKSVDNCQLIIDSCAGLQPDAPVGRAMLLSKVHTSSIFNLFLKKGLDPGSNLIRIQPILMPLTFMEMIGVMLVTFVKVLMAD